MKTNALTISNPLAIRFGDSTLVYAVKSIADASYKWRAIRDANNLSAREWMGVVVVDTITSKQVARISYNGRAWANDGKEILCAS